MNDFDISLRKLADAPEARGVLVEIVATKGSAPRTAGARMLLGPDGFVGSVGGGGLEFRAQAEARAVLERGAPLRKTFSLGSGAGEATGAICGGSATLDFRPIGPAEAAALLADRPAPPRVLLYGAGHVGKALADALALLGLQVTVTDERPELLTAERFPSAARRTLPPEDGPVDAGAADFVVIMTHSHARDYDLALRALRSSAHYVGMIGSRKKAVLFTERLLGDGIAPQALESRFHCPIGLSIGAETPEEIAVSIAAELVADLHRT